MAPIGMVGSLGWLSSPEVGIVSLVVFLVLGVTLLALCARCQRKTINAYDMKGGATTDGAGKSNGTTSGGATDPGGWRDHKSMPPSTLPKPAALSG